jgi:hypothetical protein
MKSPIDFSEDPPKRSSSPGSARRISLHHITRVLADSRRHARVRAEDRPHLEIRPVYEQLKSYNNAYAV